MTDKYRINPHFVVPEPTPADHFCFVSEAEFTDQFRDDLMGDWLRSGVMKTRLTLVNDEYPESGYPHGVWIEGWTDKDARHLPFGASYPEGGPCYPPLVALPSRDRNAERQDREAGLGPKDEGAISSKTSRESQQ